MMFSPVEYRGNYIDGSFKKVPSSKLKIDVTSPANFNDTIGSFPYSLESVSESVTAALNAFSAWSRLDQNARHKCIQKLGSILEEQREAFAKLIAREVGKPLWECRLEMADAIRRCSSNPVDMGWCWRQEELLQDTQARSLRIDYRPRGVVAVLAPFNLPVDTTLSYVLPSLFLGNTVIFKSSKQTPASAQMLAEAFDRAGFPPGVINVIQGDKEVSRRLALHSNVDVVLFTGPYELGEQIKRDAVDPVDKTLVMEMGGKNVSVVWDGADLNLATRAILEGAYLTGGQRSTATSRLIIQRSLAPEFIEKLHSAAKQIVVGNPFEEKQIPFMGALIHPVSVERYLKFQGIATREGAECIMRGKSLESMATPGHYVTPSIYLIKDLALEKIRKSIFQQTELFGPCLSVYMVDSIEEAVSVANAVDYGLCASVFTSHQETAEIFWRQLKFGNMHWNLPTTHQDIRLPFGGLGKSGNGSFTGYQLAASLVCPIGGVFAPKGAALGKLPGLPEI